MRIGIFATAATLTISADATIPVHKLFECIRQDRNRIRPVVSCRWPLLGSDPCTDPVGLS